MKRHATVLTVAVAAAFLQLPVATYAQSTTASAPSSASASAPKTPIATKSPTDWIEYDDLSYTPVVDDVTADLAAARAALGNKDNAKAAEAMQAAARTLEMQAAKAANLDRERAAVDTKQASETYARMRLLTKQLNATAQQVKAGKLPTPAALDMTLDKAARADLDRRWLVTDVTTWYPVSEEPQRHFGAAAAAYAKKDYKAAAMQVRKAAAYVRLEAARATGEAAKGLDAARDDLDHLAGSLDKGALKTDQRMHAAFARADHALAFAHRAHAVEDWTRKSYDRAGYELKAAGQGLDNAASWVGKEATGAALATAAGARAIGDKLVSGGVWTQDEVAKSFQSLGGALNRLGQAIGPKTKTSSS